MGLTIEATLRFLLLRDAFTFSTIFEGACLRKQVGSLRLRVITDITSVTTVTNGVIVVLC